MRRSRVLSFMSQWSSNNDGNQKSRGTSPTDGLTPRSKPPPIDTFTPAASPKLEPSGRESPASPSTPSRARGDSRMSTRPNSMMMTYNPLQMDVAPDTPPELQPIFNYLNAHSNKLYQEGYFLKLHDLDSRGRPSPDRVWNEVFAQLVGTVLSLWDAAALDAAGEDGEVVPTFINLGDASIRMIESLPMNGAEGGNLQNVLSVSTAANNRYLLHFNSLSSLTQWTAGIRLAMFEHSSLQEAYTGSLIAGKGRYLNNIRSIMERSKFAHEDWARVRFGAGTPWKRCWCVISPPDEKEYAKAQKSVKKTSAYERVKMPKGDIKFYDTRKVTKKTKPIATVTDAYAAYAIYPQAKPLIDQSTLVKLEGLVTIHSNPESTTEGFVFVMPESHPAVSGFEIMLRWLFPVYDSFGLYGRPQRLVADTLDQRGLMFAMPRDSRYGHLDILDVSALIHTSGSQAWSERQWKRELKKLTSERMNTHREGSPRVSRDLAARRKAGRSSLPATPGGSAVRFDGAPSYSTPGSRSASHEQIPTGDNSQLQPPRRVDSAPPSGPTSPHKRSVSENTFGVRKYAPENGSRLSHEANGYDDEDAPPPPPVHGPQLTRTYTPGSLERIQSGAEVPTLKNPVPPSQSAAPPPQPVLAPPAFTHTPNSRPTTEPYQAPELRRAHSNVDADTLLEMQESIRKSESGDRDEQWGAELPQRQHNHNPVATYVPTTQDPRGPRTDHSQGLVNSAAMTQPLQHKSEQPSNGTPSIVSPSAATSAALSSAHYADVEDSSVPAVPLEQNSTISASSLQPRYSIARKPLPRQSSDISITNPTNTDPPPVYIPTSPQPIESDSPWTGDVIDTEALDRLLDKDRQDTMTSFASSATPDYASTINSAHEPKKSIEKARAGKLKTVGDPDFQPENMPTGGAGKFDTYEADQAAARSMDLPTIDFGPTYAYKPTGRPSTGGTITPGQPDARSREHSRDRLRDRSRDRLTPNLNSSSPAEANRQSYFGVRNTPSPGVTGRNTPSPGIGRDSPNRNIVAWQPPAASSEPPYHARGASLSPEQWVQQRAAMASQPQAPPPRKEAPHSRQSSSTSVNKLRKAPPTDLPRSRTPSGDMLQQSQARLTPPSRPNSRGAGTYFNQPSGGGSLTAKEQMQIARATNSPLVNYTSSTQHKETEQHAPGLFGALAARQQEKEGKRNSIAVQQAIQARQQQQYQMEMESHSQAQAQYQTQMQMQMQNQQQQQIQYQQAMMAQGQAHARQASMQQQQAAPQSWYGTQPSAMQGQHPPPTQSWYGGPPQSMGGSQVGSPQPAWERQQAMMAQTPEQKWQQQQGRY